MKTIWTIARRELGAYFSSPVAYVFIVIFLLLTGFFTFMVGRFFERGLADLLPFFVWHPWLYLFLVPAVGMRLWSEELRLGTIELLFTMPVTPWQAILGKFLASWLFLLIALAADVPYGGDRLVPWASGSGQDFVRVWRQFSDGRHVPGHYLYDLFADAQPGRQLYSVCCDLPVSDPLQLAPHHRHRCQLGTRMVNRCVRRDRGNDPLRRLPAWRYR